MTPRYDVAIIGAGPVASALALLLARLARDPARIALTGDPLAGSPAAGSPAAGSPAARNSVSGSPAAASLAPSSRTVDVPGTGAADPRTLAMNEGSRRLLADLQAWPARCATIQTIHVSQSGRLGRTCIKHTDFGVAALGHVAAYVDLREALAAPLHASGVTRIDAIDVVALRQTDAGVHWGDGPEASCRIAVLADGAGAAADVTREYGQSAVLATVRATQPRSHWAWERFRREGPLAILPHPDGHDRYAVVWCCRSADADRLKHLDADVFSAELTAAFGERLGRLQAVGARHVYPLALKARRHPVEGRIVAVGNAAQSLHPVAGQGLNLGLRDAAQLAQVLGPWLGGQPVDAADVLSTYAAKRKLDRTITGGLTDIMPRAFSTGWPVVEHLGGTVLLALDLSSSLRTPLARQLLYGTRS